MAGSKSRRATASLSPKWTPPRVVSYDITPEYSQLLPPGAAHAWLSLPVAILLGALHGFCAARSHPLII